MDSAADPNADHDHQHDNDPEHGHSDAPRHQPEHEDGHGHEHGHSHEHGHGDGHSHQDSHGHGHGHELDRGPRALLRYARHAGKMWRSDVNDAVVATIDPKAGERVVDIGAGVGAGSVVAARAGADVVAVEPTPYMRRILGWRRALSRTAGEIEVVDGAAEATGLPDADVDAAWAVNTMHHWTDLGAGCAELARVLKPGGRAVLVDEDFEDPNHPDHERFADRHGGGGHGFHMVDHGAVRAALEAAGLEVTEAGKDWIAGRPAIVVEVRQPA